MDNMFISSMQSQASTGETNKTETLCTDDVQLKPNSLGTLPPSNGQSQEDEDMIQVSSSWFYELSQENEMLKQTNKDLMTAKIKQDSGFEAKDAKLSELLDQVVSAEKDIEKLNEKCKDYEQENSHLKLQVEELMAQAHPNGHLELKTSKDGRTGLKNKFDRTIKDIDKLNLILRACRSQLATRTTLMRKMEIHIKHLWNFLLEFGKMLASADLLVPHLKAALLKTCEDYLTLNINQNESETDIYKSLSNLSTTSMSSIANMNLQKTRNENEDVDMLAVDNSPPIFSSLSNGTSSDDKSPVKLVNTACSHVKNNHQVENKDLLQQKDNLCSDIPPEQQDTSFANIQMSFSIAPFIGQEFLNADAPKELSNAVEDQNTLNSDECRQSESHDSDPKLREAGDINFSSEIIQPTLEVLPNRPLRNVTDKDGEQGKKTPLGNAELNIEENSETNALLEDLYLSEDSVNNPVIVTMLNPHVSVRSRSPIKKANSALDLIDHLKGNAQNSYESLETFYEDSASTYVEENETRNEISVENVLSAPTKAISPLLTPSLTVVSPMKEQFKVLKCATARSSKNTYNDNQILTNKKAVFSKEVRTDQSCDEDSNHKFEGPTSSVCTSTPLKRSLSFFHTEQPSLYTSNSTSIPKSPDSKDPATNLKEMLNLNNQELNKHSVTSSKSRKSLSNCNTSLSSVNESSEDSNSSKKLQNITVNSDIKSKAVRHDVDISNEEHIDPDGLLPKPQSGLCTLTAKKFNDGSVKFGFNLAKSCTITLDPTNYNISCIFNNDKDNLQCSNLPSVNNSQCSPALLSSSYSIVERQGFEANQSPVSDGQKLLENTLSSPVSMNENVVNSSINSSFSAINAFKNLELASILNATAQTPLSPDINAKQFKDKITSDEEMILPIKIGSHRSRIISSENENIFNNSFEDKASDSENYNQPISSENTMNTFEKDSEISNTNDESIESDTLPSSSVENTLEVANDTRHNILTMQKKNETPRLKCLKRINQHSKNVFIKRFRSDFNRFNSQKASTSRTSTTNRIPTLLSIRNRIYPAKKRLRSFKTSTAVSEMENKKKDKKKPLSHKKKNTYKLESVDSDESNFPDSGPDENSNNALFSFENILSKHVREVELMKDKLNPSNENEESNNTEKNITADLVSSITEVGVQDSDVKLKEFSDDSRGFEDPTVNDDPYALFGSSLVNEDAPLHSLKSVPVKFSKSNKNVTQNKNTSIGNDFKSEFNVEIDKDNCSKSSVVSLQLLDSNTCLVEELTDHISPTPENFVNVISKHSDKFMANQSIMNKSMPTLAKVLFNKNTASNESDTDSTDFDLVVHEANAPMVSSNTSNIVPKSLEENLAKHVKGISQDTWNTETPFVGALLNNHDTMHHESKTDTTSISAVEKETNNKVVSNKEQSSFEDILTKHMKDTVQDALHDTTPSAGVLLNNHDISLPGGDTDSTLIGSVLNSADTPLVSSIVPSTSEENLAKHVKQTCPDTFNDETPSAGILLNNHDASLPGDDTHSTCIGSMLKDTDPPMLRSILPNAENLAKPVKPTCQDTSSDETPFAEVHEIDADSTNIGSVQKEGNNPMVSIKVLSTFEEILAKHMKETVQNTLHDETSSAGKLLNDDSNFGGDPDSTGISSLLKNTNTPVIFSIKPSSFKENLAKHVKRTCHDTLNDDTISAGVLLNNHDACQSGDTDTTNAGFVSKDIDTSVVSNKVPGSFEEILVKHMKEQNLMEKRPSSPNFTELKKDLMNVSFEDILVAHIEDVKLIKENKKQLSGRSEKNHTASISNKTSLDNEVNDADSTASEHSLIITDGYSSSISSPTKAGSTLNQQPSRIMTKVVEKENSSEKFYNPNINFGNVISSNNTVSQLSSETGKLIECDQVCPESIIVNSDVVSKEVVPESIEHETCISTNLGCEQINVLVHQNANNDEVSMSYNSKTSDDDEEIDNDLFSNPKLSVLENKILKTSGGKTIKSSKAIKVKRVSKLPPVWVKRGKEFKTKDSATASFNEGTSCEMNKSAQDDATITKKDEATPFTRKSHIIKQVKKQITSTIPDYFSKAGNEGISSAQLSLNVVHSNSGQLNEFVPSSEISDYGTLGRNCPKMSLYPGIKPCFVLLNKMESLSENIGSDISDINNSPLKSKRKKSYMKRGKSRRISDQRRKKSILKETEGVVSVNEKSFSDEFKISTNENSSLCEIENNSVAEQTSIDVNDSVSAINEGKSQLKKCVRTSPRKRKYSAIIVDSEQELDTLNDKFIKNKRKKTGSDTHGHIKMFQTGNNHKADTLKNRRLSQASIRSDANDNSNCVESGNTKRNVFDRNQILSNSRSCSKIIEKLDNSLDKESFSRLKVKTIKDAFHSIQMQHENLDLETSAQSLKIIISDPENYPDVSSLLFSVINYLCDSEVNPIFDFLESENVSVLLPREENCIAASLFLIESEEIPHLKGLLETAVNEIQHLISKKTIHNDGLASLCRVVTEISKRKEDTFVPLSLCSTLLKMKHQFAPYLIASVAGIWRELFQVEEGLSDEEIIFHSAIAYGAKKKTEMPEIYWIASMKIISKYFDSRSVVDVQKSIRLLMNIILINCCDDSWTYSYNLTSALVIFSVHEEWEWTKEHVLNSFIVRNLNRFGKESNEKAFDVFCNLYVDIFLVNPSQNPEEEKVLVQFFQKDKFSKGCSVIQQSAALALTKLCKTNSKIQLPKIITNWFELNCNDPKVRAIKQLLKKK